MFDSQHNLELTRKPVVGVDLRDNLILMLLPKPIHELGERSPTSLSFVVGEQPDERSERARQSERIHRSPIMTPNVKWANRARDWSSA